MAEAAVVLFAVENLDDLLIRKAAFLRGVKEQVRRLIDELRLMQPLLRVTEKQDNNERRRSWISLLRELAQDAEDVIEALVFKLDTPRRSSGLLGIFTYYPNHVYHPNRVGKEIRSIRARLQEILSERYNFRILLSPPPGRSETIERRLISTPWQIDEDVVGLEEDVEVLLNRVVLEETRGLSIAGIVGVSGIGKTTLARKIFNHDEVARRFVWRAWVVISSEFRLERTIKELLLQLLRRDEDDLRILEAMEGLQEPSLHQMLYGRLDGRRYFIVLDGVCEDSQLAALTQVFPNQGQGSRLLITSRNRNISRHGYYVHEMKVLDPRDSWQLFLKTVFLHDNDNNCPEHLENTGKEIVRKCHGLPSAIKKVGGLLVAIRSPREWQEVLQTMNLSVMAEILESSYHELPPELKLCFLCLGFFREGATIRAEKVAHILIAGGMVRQGGEMNAIMEEMARSYLGDLISRNMVQVEDMTKDHRVKNCHINDLFREPAIRKAEEEISLEILREEGNRPRIHKPRHRAIYCSRERFVYSMNQDKYLRSLFFHGGGNFDASPSNWKSFKLLRILNFEDFGLTKLPDKIGELTGLRYLGLRNNYLQELPESLGCLQNLKVLDIALNFTVVVPNVLWKMDSLRHLYMSDIVCRTPLRIDTLKKLQTLTYISVDNWTYERSSLQMMTSLRKLGIEELDEHSNVSELFTSLANLENLSCLSLRGSSFKRMPSLDELGNLDGLTQLKLDGLLTALPSADTFPPNLAYLTLVNTSLDDDPMPVLEKLSRLVYLKLRNAYNGDEMVISHEGFRSLEVLCIGELWHLRDVGVARSAMRMLRRLEINNCPYLESLPEEVGSMPRLKELKMVTTPDIATMILDSDIISNIPNVDIQS